MKFSNVGVKDLPTEPRGKKRVRSPGPWRTAEKKKLEDKEHVFKKRKLVMEHNAELKKEKQRKRSRKVENKVNLKLQNKFGCHVKPGRDPNEYEAKNFQTKDGRAISEEDFAFYISRALAEGQKKTRIEEHKEEMITKKLKEKRRKGKDPMPPRFVRDVREGRAPAPTGWGVHPDYYKPPKGSQSPYNKGAESSKMGGSKGGSNDRQVGLVRYEDLPPAYYPARPPPPPPGYGEISIDNEPPPEYDEYDWISGQHLMKKQLNKKTHADYAEKVLEHADKAVATYQKYKPIPSPTTGTKENPLSIDSPIDLPHYELEALREDVKLGLRAVGDIAVTAAGVYFKVPNLVVIGLEMGGDGIIKDAADWIGDHIIDSALVQEAAGGAEIAEWMFSFKPLKEWPKHILAQLYGNGKGGIAKVIPEYYHPGQAIGWDFEHDPDGWIAWDAPNFNPFLFSDKGFTMTKYKQQPQYPFKRSNK